MKIGIMTFHKSINYGSVLQAYALAYRLREMGHTPEIIDYEQHNYTFQYQIIKPPLSMEAIKHDYVNMVFYDIMKERKLSFEKFRKNILPLSAKQYKYGDDLSELDDMYDILICGSDQLWNTNASDFDEAYFFPFIKKTPHIAYAVSLNKGELTNAPDPALLKDALRTFSAISAREESGKRKIEKFMGNSVNVPVVLDPTLLNDKKAYFPLSEKRVIKEPYVFFYSVNYQYEAVRAAVTAAERTGLPVYTLTAGKGTRALYRVKKEGKINILKKNIGPSDFLSLIRYAQLVVTNSFHGTAFSLIFEKNFYSIKAITPEGKLEYDTRLYNILTTLGVENRYVAADDMKTADLAAQLDYTDINEKRISLIQQSLEYLEKYTGNSAIGENV